MVPETVESYVPSLFSSRIDLISEARHPDTMIGIQYHSLLVRQGSRTDGL